MARKTILIADDSKTAQMLVRTTLQRMPGLEFRAADNGRDALDVLAKERVDLLVTDVNMPEMDGIELVREVRAGGFTLPILIITAKDEQRARERGLALGANGYVLKPINGAELLRAAGELLRT
jgi:two-component system chemotaxis response regulator CheY